MLYKKFSRLLLISFVIGLGISLMNLFVNQKSGFVLENFVQSTAINTMFAFFITFVNEAFFNMLNKYVPWTTKAAARLILGVVGSVVLTMGVLFLIIGFTQIIIYDVTWNDYIARQSVDWYFSGIVITLFISVIFHAFYFYKELQSVKIKEQKIIAGTATAQFDALKNQLDPHFLFNSLNVLVSLIEENPDAAVNFTTSLSKVYRYVLEQRGKELVPLEEELVFARTYVRLLKMRFEESLDINIPEAVTNPDLQIVPLSLQLLIENAVKHNIVSSNKPLKLSIYEADGRLIIENNLQEKAVVKDGTGVGLNNIASRYALLTIDKMTIEKANGLFKVNLPLLDKNKLNTHNKQIMETSIQDIKLTKAKEQVQGIKKFYDDTVRTAIIIAMLGLLNYFTGGFPWVIFPAIGMGIGLLFQYMRSFDKSIFMGKTWENQKINELMNDQNF